MSLFRGSKGYRIANAQQVADRIGGFVAEAKPSILLLDLSGVFDIEYSALQMMIECDQRLAEQGVDLWLAGLNSDVLAYVRGSGFADRLGRDRMFPTAGAGVRHHQDNAQAPIARRPGT
ncbi:STAS domain-containing protein [Rhizobium leguminosarum]|uniref:STAS domain-containing protein n=1 Tax=Rhizobium leguminosarum TaxID=384 RepID=UPI000DDBD2E1